MAFDIKGFQTVADGGRLTGVNMVQMHHSYITNDVIALVEGANYFNPAAAFIKTGDSLRVTGDVDGTPFGADYVCINTDGVITLTPFADSVP